MPPSVVFVIAPERFREEELLEPQRLLEQAGARVTVVSTRGGVATGMAGARVRLDGTVRRADLGCDALVIAGGDGAPGHLWDSEPLRALVRAVHAAGRPVGAICLAPPVLARAGVLAGKRATTYPTDRAIAELKRGGAAYVKEPVVSDGTIVTASGPEAAAAFGQTLTRLLAP
ncbi:MAG TPA: DJ-1/PfpI family protein [Gemmatimonadales bacterium]|nr:DJ-1/PfpI family protein [Gemmatimonadales bacterium]